MICRRLSDLLTHLVVDELIFYSSNRRYSVIVPIPKKTKEYN